MYYLVLIVFSVLLAGCNEPDAASSPGALPAAPQDFAAAIETIATSTDTESVQVAARLLREGGLPALATLAAHLDDKRLPPTDCLTRAVDGTSDPGDHCFWLIQDMLESHQTLQESSFSGLSRDNTAEWLAQRKELRLVELQRDACRAAIETLERYIEAHPTFDGAREMTAFKQRLAALDASVQGEQEPGKENFRN